MDGQCDLVFCAVDMPKAETKKLEEAYAKAETPVISNNSRSTPLHAGRPHMLPKSIPGTRFNIPSQRRRLGTKRGFSHVKPNCSTKAMFRRSRPCSISAYS
jgi:aspartate-semialdehyde dehydrogenase